MDYLEPRLKRNQGKLNTANSFFDAKQFHFAQTQTKKWILVRNQVLPKNTYFFMLTVTSDKAAYKITCLPPVRTAVHG